MRFRLSTLLVVVAIFAIATTTALNYTGHPRHIRILISHINTIPNPCTDKQFEQAIEKCEINVTPNQGNDSLLIWNIGSGTVDSNQTNRQSPQQAKPRNGAHFSLRTEYATVNSLGERLVNTATIVKTDLRTGADTQVWTWPNQKP